MKPANWQIDKGKAGMTEIRIMETTPWGSEAPPLLRSILTWDSFPNDLTLTVAADGDITAWQTRRSWRAGRRLSHYIYYVNHKGHGLLAVRRATLSVFGICEELGIDINDAKIKSAGLITGGSEWESDWYVPEKLISDLVKGISGLPNVLSELVARLVSGECVTIGNYKTASCCHLSV